MKYFKTATIVFLILLSNAFVKAGINGLFKIHSLKFGVRITEDQKNIVLTFNKDIEANQHSIIDIMRVNNLKYKTRLMRYFGGLLKTKTYHFEKLIIVDDDRSLELNFNRENVSLVINQICHYAEHLALQPVNPLTEGFKE